ncbi:uncharacterized protein ACA1_338990 [Acanthamoeba castellanii str. Neff]|uniref:Uncharacterized protein n=1 Tax=Acanthamoeba castellanii (strain ATCC 30010 / Neff) TaxID=1257118 RepID=L8H4D5_ACACF|nr:uncharacterized protein ACA1_338990 [Acanthamoeba castellanii str. Neff]ELR20399.1 hypothetical protein ACA1_338990 [Acanthamoeba castellanii str. Neff]
MSYRKKIPEDAMENEVSSSSGSNSGSDSEIQGHCRRTTVTDKVSYRKTIPEDPIEPAKKKKKTTPKRRNATPPHNDESQQAVVVASVDESLLEIKKLLGELKKDVDSLGADSVRSVTMSAVGKLLGEAKEISGNLDWLVSSSEQSKIVFGPNHKPLVLTKDLVERILTSLHS